jgi:TRAP-type C4-dicarboxylate transport system permease small subunit
MIRFESGVRKTSEYISLIAGAAIVIMMLLSTADVLLRLGVPLFSKLQWWFLSFLKPIPGTYELVSFLGTVAAAFAMARTSIQGGHVSVSLVTRLLPERVRNIIQIITNSLALIFFGLLSWRSILYAEELRFCGEVSMTLQLPYYPFIYGVAFASFAMSVVLITYLIHDIKELK